MLLDAESFRQIKGWPETDCFTHMDTAVCFVAWNSFVCAVPSPGVCTYTFIHEGRKATDEQLENYQWQVCTSYANKKTCN